MTVNAVSLGCSENHHCGRNIFTRSMKVTGVWGFFTCHTQCILIIRNQNVIYKCPTGFCDTHKNHRTTREHPPPPLSSYYSYTCMCPHICCTSTCSLLTASRRSSKFLSTRSTQETIFVHRCTLIMTYSSGTGDQCTRQALSQQEKKAFETEKQ